MAQLQSTNVTGSLIASTFVSGSSLRVSSSAAGTVQLNTANSVYPTEFGGNVRFDLDASYPIAASSYVRFASDFIATDFYGSTFFGRNLLIGNIGGSGVARNNTNAGSYVFWGPGTIQLAVNSAGVSGSLISSNDNNYNAIFISASGTDALVGINGVRNPTTALQINGTVSASAFSSSINNAVGYFGTASFAVSASWAPAGSSGGIGKYSLWVPAGAWYPRFNNGAQGLTQVTHSFDGAISASNLATMDFDPATNELTQTFIALPKGWNTGSLTAKVYWSHPSTATNFGVVWGIRSVQFTDNESINGKAFGSAVEVTDTGGITDRLYISSETSAFTAGTPAAKESMITLELYRSASNASDTLAVDSRLHGVMLYYTRDTSTDA